MRHENQSSLHRKSVMHLLGHKFHAALRGSLPLVGYSSYCQLRVQR
ncbi:Uncharacterised protein [Vibrio cholerae]|uniref:Uncharacterized protein n=1 Tax=Vibrio cholerae TaxID=666 RepID=A0A656ALZ0_VIBCL|nr:Uncharacterised protein [Vibrio cholerae]